eukprot:evm.model.scf_1401.2 EVM.evm.TU.scf_1401.2   scf_1401:21296-26103(-)
MRSLEVGSAAFAVAGPLCGRRAGGAPEAGRKGMKGAKRDAAQPAGRGRAGLQVSALDAAQCFDFEGRLQEQALQENQLKIGFVGFGKFGQFLAKRFSEQGHQIVAMSRSPHFSEAEELGVEFCIDGHDFCESHPDVVVLSTSIISLESVLESLPLQRLKRSTLMVDVLSVKEFPKRLLLRKLPPELDIMCTHPMFGPDSGRESWEGLNFMFDRVRIGECPERQRRSERFLQIFESEGCNMVEMSCEEHDRKAASTQFITHTVGRVLGTMDLERTNLDTKGYQSLVDLVDNTAHDSFDLYYGLFMYNQNATSELDRLERAFQDVKRQLFDQLHGVLREELFQLRNNVVQSPRRGEGGFAPPGERPLGAKLGSSNGHSFNGNGTVNGNGYGDGARSSGGALEEGAVRD